MINILNKEQTKHIANSLRMIGVGQFAYYGVKELSNDITKFKIVGVTVGVYFLAETLAVFTLKGKQNGK